MRIEEKYRPAEVFDSGKEGIWSWTIAHSKFFKNLLSFVFLFGSFKYICISFGRFLRDKEKADSCNHLLKLANLQHSLTEVGALEQAQQALGRVVDALRDALLGLEGAFGDPLLHVLLVVDGVLGAHVWVEDLFDGKRRVG